MARRLTLSLLLAGLFFTSDLHASKFRAAGGDEPVVGRYVVTLEAAPRDLEREAHAIAALYGARLEPYAAEDRQSFAVAMPPARARILSMDGRVRSVTEVRAEPAAVEAAADPVRPPLTPAPAGTGKERWTYRYDSSGNIRSIRDPGRQIVDNFAYDTAGRVVVAMTDGNRQNFSYDAFGNRVRAELVGNARLCSDGTRCGGALAITPTTNRLSSDVAVYDAAGSLTQLNAVTQYTYDAFGMMRTSSTGAGLDQREYIYTADDERLAVRSNGATEWTIRRLDAKPLRDFRESAGTLTWSQDHIWRGSHLLATVRPAADGTTTTYHHHLDHLGTPRLITDGAGVEVARHSYYAFGPELQNAAPESPELRLKFTGHERDLIPGSASSLDYMHARYYSATMGRFLSVDPTWESADLRRPQSWNRYSYVMNNSVNMMDPDGRCPTCPIYLQEAWLYASDPRTAQQAVQLGVRLWGLVTLAEQAEAAGDAADDVDESHGTDGVVRVSIDGSYEIVDWSGYPSGAPEPDGPFRLREGREQQEARSAADKANQAIHRHNPDLKGQQIHEIHPVKHGGSPTDPANKIALTARQHALFSTWWRRIQQRVEHVLEQMKMSK